MITAARRTADGLLADIQDSPGLPAVNTPRLNNGTAQFGGVPGDYEVMEVPSNLWTGINTAARQFTTLSAGVITAVNQSTPPSASSDKAQIDNDGLDTATITCNVGDVAYTGVVKFTVCAPDGSQISGTKNAVAGVASETMTTTLEGVHSVICETVLHGVAVVTVEGI